MGWSAEGVVSQVLHQLETYTAALLCAIGFLTGAGAMLYGAAVVDVMREKKTRHTAPPNQTPPNDFAWRSKETKRPHITECQHCERQSSKMFFRGFSLN
jgi:hypothetical protein